MSLLREIIEGRIGDIVRHEGASEWEISCASSDTCTVATPNLELNFYIDNRNKQISSAIEYQGIPERFRDTLYTQVLFELFPEISFNDGLNTNDIAKRIEIELDNIGKLLDKIRKNEITYRDLFFFSDGYNAGYTYVYSRDPE